MQQQGDHKETLIRFLNLLQVLPLKITVDRYAVGYVTKQNRVTSREHKEVEANENKVTRHGRKILLLLNNPSAPVELRRLLRKDCSKNEWKRKVEEYWNTRLAK